MYETVATCYVKARIRALLRWRVTWKRNTSWSDQLNKLPIPKELRERLFNACTARKDMPERIAETFKTFRKRRIGELDKLRTATTIHHSSYIMAHGPSQSGKTTTVKAKRRPPENWRDHHRQSGKTTTAKLERRPPLVGRRPPRKQKDDHRQSGKTTTIKVERRPRFSGKTTTAKVERRPPSKMSFCVTLISCTVLK